MLTSQPISFPNYSTRVERAVVPADPDIVLISQNTIPVDAQAQLILSAIGGTELIQIARHDMVNGEKVIYQPIADVNEFAASASNVIGFAETLAGYKNKFGINLDNHIEVSPDSSGPNYSDVQDNSIVASIINDDGTNVVEIALASAMQDVWFTRSFNIDGGSAESSISGYIDGGDSLGYNVDITTDGGNI